MMALREKAMAFDPHSGGRADERERAHSAIDILISWDNFIVTIQNGVRARGWCGNVIPIRLCYMHTHSRPSSSREERESV